MVFSVALASLITNVTVKPLVARHRPYASGVSDYVEWWKYVGGHTHSEYSFPSGHTTSAMAAMLAKGMTPVDAARAAKDYINGAIVAGAGYEIGGGHGPVHHFHEFWK